MILIINLSTKFSTPHLYIHSKVGSFLCHRKTHLRLKENAFTFGIKCTCVLSKMHLRLK